jgi:hypothetical protein
MFKVTQIPDIACMQGNLAQIDNGLFGHFVDIKKTNVFFVGVGDGPHRREPGNDSGWHIPFDPSLALGASAPC